MVQRLFRYLAITVVFTMVGNTTAQGAPCLGPIKLLSAAASVCMGLSACSVAHHRTTHAAAIMSSTPVIADAIEQKLQSQDYRWVLHIHFRPNDFHLWNERTFKMDLDRGEFISSETQELFQGGSFHSMRWRGRNLASATPLFQDSPYLIGEFEFHYDQHQAAIKFINELFSDPEQSLSQTFLIVSAGSHGSSSADSFINSLRKEFGKNSDIIVFGDAIAQPFLIPKWIGDPGDAIAINFYQRNDFLAGAPVTGFYNIKLEEGSHVSVSNYSEHIGSQIARTIDLSQRSPNLFELTDVQYRFQEYAMDLRRLGFSKKIVSEAEEVQGSNFLTASTQFLHVLQTVLEATQLASKANQRSHKPSLRNFHAQLDFYVAQFSSSSNFLSQWTALHLLQGLDSAEREDWRGRLGIDHQDPKFIFSLPSFEIITPEQPNPGSFQLDILGFSGISRSEAETLVQWLKFQSENYWEFRKWKRSNHLENKYLGQFSYKQDTRSIWIDSLSREQPKISPQDILRLNRKSLSLLAEDIKTALRARNP